MKFAKMPAALRAFSEESINMGGIAIETIAKNRIRLSLRRPGIARVAHRYLTAIPGQARQSQCLLNEVDGPAGKRGACVDGTCFIVFKGMDADKPGPLIAPPAGILRISHRAAGGRPCPPDPIGQGWIVGKAAPAISKECVVR